MLAEALVECGRSGRGNRPELGLGPPVIDGPLYELGDHTAGKYLPFSPSCVSFSSHYLFYIHYL